MLKIFRKDIKIKEFQYAIPFAVLFFLLFYFFEKSGFNLITQNQNINYATAFLIGLTASFSSCMIVVGGLLISLSETFSRIGNKFFSHFTFHLGRFISFFFLGGIIGFTGSFITISIGINFSINFLIGLSMLILGINLLGIFNWLKIFNFFVPKSIVEKIKYFSNKNHPLAPFLIGLLTFFLPCGFTQTMQFYTLGSGGFWIGAMTMFFFALGTFPVLFLISFSSVGLEKSKYVGIFLKTSGSIVLIFAFIIIFNSFEIIGFNLNRFYENSEKESRLFKKGEIDKNILSENVFIEDDIQIIKISARGGYLPFVSVAQSEIETVIRFETEMTYDCSVVINLPSINLNQVLPPSGLTDVEIGTPLKGFFRGSCGMGMFPFEIYFK